MQAWAAVDIMKGRVVTLLRGDPSMAKVWNTDAIAAAGRWQDEGADGLHIVDLDRALGTGSNERTILSLMSEVRLPVQVGGGIRSVGDAVEWIERGASRVVIGTMAFAEPGSLGEIVSRIGPGSVAVAIDYRRGFVTTNGWKRDERISVAEAAEAVGRAGVGTVIVTAVERDGTAEGPDFGTYRRLRNSIGKMKLLASGGISSVEDVKRLGDLGVDGVVLGRTLYERTIRLADLRQVKK